ncbi:MAG: PfkB family carbohydrate kinase, partial [Candidatus Aminicenantales bacterium]
MFRRYSTPLTGQVNAFRDAPGCAIFIRKERGMANIVTFGGAEANVAVSLAILGHRSRWISIVPANPVGEAALRELRRYGVDV